MTTRTLTPEQQRLLQHRTFVHGDPDPYFEVPYDCELCGVLEARIYHAERAKRPAEDRS